MAGNDWKQHLDRIIDGLDEQMVQVRRHLHMHPEPSGQEVQTTQYLASQVREAGLTARLGLQDRGVLVQPPDTDAKDSRPGPGIAFRGDIDALRIQETRPIPYRSRVPGIMHACGHDAHSAIVVGAAMALHTAAQQRLLPWPVGWRAILQPAEETNRGAREMMQAGALDDVEAILGLHIDPARPVGSIAVRSGIITADCDEIEVHIRGRGGHASRPHETIDPIAAAAQLISSIYQAIPRVISPHEPVVVTIGSIHGGGNYNVIPDQVLLGGTLRSLGSQTRGKITGHIRQTAAAIAAVTGTKIDIRFRPGPPSVYNDPHLTELVRLCARELLTEDQLQRIGPPSMGGEDFANYLADVPGCMFRLGCAPEGETAPPLHSPEFDLDERCLGIGAKLLARAVVQWWDPSVRREGSSS
jgi:amidohydrolase